MKPGDSAEVTRTFSSQDLVHYSRLCGHKAAANLERVPGPLIGSLFTSLLGMKLPGMGSVYLEQETSYQPGAVIGQPLTAKVEITRLRPEQHLVELATSCRLDNGSIVARGRALVYIGDLLQEPVEDA